MLQKQKSDKFRILHCIPTLEHGGAQRQLSYLASEMVKMGHEVHVAFLHGGANLAKIEEAGVVPHRLRSGSNYDPFIFGQLLGLIRRIRPDIIQTWILQMDILAGIAAEVSRTPWVLREPSSERAYPRTLKHSLRRWVGARARGIVANSEGGEAYWRGRGKLQMLQVIPNGFPLEEIEKTSPALHERLGLPAGRKVILYAGRFERGKNIETLITALHLVSAEEPVIAVLAGDGPLRPSIQAIVDRLGISDKVVLPGFLPDVWAWMKLADVFVFVSMFEGFPNIVVEAMGCGCPLVISDIPAHREFLDERCSLLVDPGQPQEIARAIRSVLAGPDEAAARARIAREKVVHWSVALLARRYEQLYQDVLREKDIPSPKREA